MLDAETKLRIDTARQMLVGKVPTPTGQVEQITIALIYKFMDDMDAEAEELGGKRKFFTGKFAKYGWAQLMSPSLGGHDMITLYSEGIDKMPENPGIPLLFRDIFKNAYLPYRDPETLKGFLKIINEFNYDHSERLGDAFEYLLSVLGSQGDAGQFRTPRHIIDFIVKIVNPQKGEVVLDPACGTAGFLISAYKHIVKANTDAKGQSKLTPADRGKLAENFKGYDISPDMVRLSLVNMYLHGFTDPHIYEYDTLTSDERWNEYADVILANPPFMSPKGGIKPHKRFSIQAKRSEVLFVDYMAEHLTPKGRAGIIVPEGIIFQSQTAYRQLRKMLVEDYLVAVVSLPAGCFNPYSGVKTSILILDKALAKQAQTIAFFKVESDGFGLGAQRRAIEQNDLPQVKEELGAYLRALHSKQPTADLRPTCGLIVAKEKIAANGDYNFSGERYREGAASKSEYPHVTLSEVCEINPDTASPTELYPNSYFNYIDISCVENESGKFLGPNKTTADEAPSRARRLVKQGDVLMSTVRPNLKAFAVLTEIPERAIASTGFAVLRAKPEQLLPGFLINVLRDQKSVDQMIGMAGKGAYPSINQSDVESIQIPLPPLEVQEEIVTEIEAYQKIINGARAVVDNYRPHIPVHPDWPMVELGGVVQFINGDRGENYPSAKHRVSSGVPFVNAGHLKDGDISLNDMDYISKDRYELLGDGKFVRGDILYCLRGSLGKCALVESVEFGAIASSLVILRSSDRINSRFLYSLLIGSHGRDLILQNNTGAAQPNLSAGNVKKYKIPVPPIATQQTIVAEIEAEQALINANRELIARFEKKIQTVLARVWGEDGSEKNEEAEAA